MKVIGFTDEKNSTMLEINFKSSRKKKRRAAANTYMMIVCVSGLVSRGGGEDAIQE